MESMFLEDDIWSNVLYEKQEASTWLSYTLSLAFRITVGSDKTEG